ncbi:MAG: molybdenum ABC transporter ATP-binding protein [Paraglaciecola sp.]|uniref:molybdenum ABC transporter ATP-binding protein n=2 Tax=Paraglaciecola sp. TaxID=1920173 RepID=UPI003299E8BF
MVGEPSGIEQRILKARFQLMHANRSNGCFTLDVDFSVQSEGVTAIFGESGSGKTTLLRCIAGLQKSPSAYLSFNGEVWQDKATFKATHKRSIGYVFQEPSLFEHLTVMGNLSYAIKRASNKPSDAFYSQVIDVLGIKNLLAQGANQLSGGEKQRVAIARALLLKPKLLLMDEPLASLDVKRKLEILPYLGKLKASFGIPVLYVTHSVDEIMSLADRVLILEGGKLVNQGGVPELVSNIHFSAQTRDDIGIVLDCNILEVDEQWQLMKVAFDGGQLWLPKRRDELSNSQCRLKILANDISVTIESQRDTSILNQLPVEVIAMIPEDACATSLLKVKAGATTILVRVTNKSLSQLALVSGQKVWIQVKTVAIIR